jgi:hypothetical protein
MGASRWLTWMPAAVNANNVEAPQSQGEGLNSGFDGFDGDRAELTPIISADFGDRAVPSLPTRSERELIQIPPTVEPSKPSLDWIAIEQVRKQPLFAPIPSPTEPPSIDHPGAKRPNWGKQNETANVCAPLNCPPLPMGLRLIRYVPKTPPVKLDDSSSVTNLKTFLDAELRELGARLHSPVQIRGGYGVFAILDRLRQVGLEIEIAVE